MRLGLNLLVLINKKRLADVTLKVSDGVFAFPVLLSVTAWLAQNVTLYT